MSGFDEEMEAPMAAFAAKLREMEEKVVRPLQRVDPDMAATFTPLRQAALSLACAFTAVSAYKVYRQLNDLPTDEQVELKFLRVQDYIKKIREISEIEIVRAQFGGGGTVGEESAKKKATKKSLVTGPKINKAATQRIVEHHTGKRANAAPASEK
jgi:hypothetical protein